MVRRRPLPRLAQGQLRQLTPHRTAVRSCAARSACGGALRSPQLGRLRRDSRAADLRGRCTTSPRTGAAQLRATATETTARGGGPLSSACSATTKRCAASGCLSLCHCRRELRSSLRAGVDSGRPGQHGGRGLQEQRPEGAAIRRRGGEGGQHRRRLRRCAATCHLRLRKPAELGSARLTTGAARRRHGGRPHAFRAARAAAGGVPRAAHARRHDPRAGLAHGQIPAQAGGDDGRHRW